MAVAASRLTDQPAASLIPVLERTVAEADERGQPSGEALDALRQSGVLGAAVPEAHGGLGGDAVVVNRMVRQVARVDASMAIVLFQHFAVTARIVEHGTPEQCERILPALASGKWLAASAWSETGAGASKRNLSTVAVRLADGGWELDGAKSFVTGAGLADIYLVLAQTGERTADDGQTYGADGQTFFLVEATNPGLTAERGLDLLGMRASSTGGLRLHGCRVPADATLGPIGKAAGIIAGVRQSGASLGAVSVGIAEAGYDHLVTVMRRRGQLDNPAVRQRIVDLATRIEAARATVEWAGRREADDPGLVTLHSKLFASDTCESVLADIGQLLGSAAFLRTDLTNRLCRDARAIALMGPTNDLCRELVSTQCLR